MAWRNCTKQGFGCLQQQSLSDTAIKSYQHVLKDIREPHLPYCQGHQGTPMRSTAIISHSPADRKRSLWVKTFLLSAWECDLFPTGDHFAFQRSPSPVRFFLRTGKIRSNITTSSLPSLPPLPVSSYAPCKGKDLFSFIILGTRRLLFPSQMAYPRATAPDGRVTIKSPFYLYGACDLQLLLHHTRHSTNTF